MAEIKLMAAGGDGVFLELSLPVKELAVKRDELAADMLELSLWGEVRSFPSFLRLYLDDKLIFDGIVDDMIVSSGGKGIATELVARDKVSLLTDNQLRPCSLRNPSLRLFAERYLAPLGFTAVGNMVPFHGEMKIAEGTSVLKGIASFCRNYLGQEVQLKGHTLYCNGQRPAENVAALPVISREKTMSRYQVPSKIYMKNSRSAAYSACSENPQAMGFERVVYGEGDFEVKESLELLLAGFAEIYPGDIYDSVLRAESVRVSFDGKGWKTRITGKEL